MAANARRHGAMVLASALLAATAAWMLTPRLPAQAPAPDLAGAIPTRFGDWAMVPTPNAQVDLAVATEGDLSTDRPYDQAVMRTYANTAGQQVMLAVAYGRNQRQEIKIHRPELCYTAQGFTVAQAAPTTFDLSGATTSTNTIAGRRLYAEAARGNEAVSYWIRIGDVYSDSALQTRTHILAEGLKGRVTDGALVRASMLVGSRAEAQAVQPLVNDFLRALIQATPEPARRLLVR